MTAVNARPKYTKYFFALSDGPKEMQQLFVDAEEIQTKAKENDLTILDVETEQLPSST